MKVVLFTFKMYMQNTFPFCLTFTSSESLSNGSNSEKLRLLPLKASTTHPVENATNTAVKERVALRYEE